MAAAKKSVRFYYRDEYVYDVLERGIRHTFDVERPRKIRDALVRCGALKADALLAAPPIDDEDLCLVHAPAYVAAIKNPRTLARYLLLDPAHPWGPRATRSVSLRFRRHRRCRALRGGGQTIAVNLAGGYHHAQPDKAEGFCAIADVAIAIVACARKGFASVF